MPAQLAAIGSILLMLVVCVLVIFAAYYATKLMGRKYVNHSGGSSCMKVLDRLALGPDRTLVIVQVADKTLLMGVTQQHIEMICEIEAERLPEIKQPESAEPFAAMLQNLMRKNNFRFQPEKDDKRDGS